MQRVVTPLARESCWAPLQAGCHFGPWLAYLVCSASEHDTSLEPDFLVLSTKGDRPSSRARNALAAVRGALGGLSPLMLGAKAWAEESGISRKVHLHNSAVTTYSARRARVSQSIQSFCLSSNSCRRKASSDPGTRPSMRVAWTRLSWGGWHARPQRYRSTTTHSLQLVRRYLSPSITVSPPSPPILSAIAFAWLTHMCMYARNSIVACSNHSTESPTGSDPDPNWLADHLGMPRSIRFGPSLPSIPIFVAVLTHIMLHV